MLDDSRPVLGSNVWFVVALLGMTALERASAVVLSIAGCELGAGCLGDRMSVRDVGCTGRRGDGPGRSVVRVQGVRRRSVCCTRSGSGDVGAGQLMAGHIVGKIDGRAGDHCFVDVAPETAPPAIE